MHGSFFEKVRLQHTNTRAVEILSKSASVAGLSLNDEFEEVNITEKQSKIDPGVAKKAVGKLKPAAEKLRAVGRALLESLG